MGNKLDNEYQSRAFDLLERFANNRPGLDPQNYGDGAACRSEARAITADLSRFRRVMGGCHWRNFTPAQIREAFRRAYSGRLSLVEGANGMPERLVYCAGQYFPTEYRKAATAVLASLLWDYQRENMPENPQPNAGDWLRLKFRKEFGNAIASRYFN